MYEGLKWKDEEERVSPVNGKIIKLKGRATEP